MKLAFMIMVAGVAVFLLAASFGPMKESQAVVNNGQMGLSTKTHPAVVAAKDEVVCEEIPVVESFPAEDIPESETSWKDMVSQTNLLWQHFFDGVSNKDPRRANFHVYAEYVADAVTAYQNKDTDIGGRLPRHDSAHLLVATAITIEASVNSNVVGKKGEIGLMQLMPNGPAMAGLEPKFIAKRPKLNVLLGARWLAHAVHVCYPEGIPDEEWTDENWLGPLSVYVAGERKAVDPKTGKCREFGVARKRVNRMKLYRTWIMNEIDLRGRN